MQGGTKKGNQRRRLQVLVTGGNLPVRSGPPFFTATMVKLVVRSELPWLEVVPLSPVLVGNGSGDLAWYQPGSLVPGCQHRRSTQSSESGAGQLF